MDSSISNVAKSSNLDWLLPVRSALLNLLFHCYVDSAMLPPIPASGLDSVIQAEVEDGEQLESWDDVYMDECRSKVFSLLSQEEDNLIEVSHDMSADDMVRCLSTLSNGALTLIPGKDAPFEARIRGSPQRKSKRVSMSPQDKSKQSAEGHGPQQGIAAAPDMIKVLHKIRALQKSNIAARNVKSLKQRAYMKFLVLYFVRFQAVEMWKEKVQIPMMEYTGPPTSLLYEKHSVSHPTTAKQKKKRGNRFAHSAKCVQEGNEHLDDAVGEDPFLRDVLQIKRHVEYILSMLLLVHSLLLRRFFDQDYNANPVYDGSTRPVSKNETFNSVLYGFDNDKTPEPLTPERMPPVKDSEEEEKGESPEHLEDNSVHSGWFGRKKKYHEDEEEGKASTPAKPASLFYDFVEDPMYQMVTRRLTSGRLVQVLEMKCNEADLIRGILLDSNDEAQPNIDRRQWDNKEREISSADTGPVREIISCCINIIKTAPSQLIDPKFNVNDDEKMLDDYFRRQYGYVKDPYGLTDSCIDVKMMCCKILLVCLELMHSKTAKSLYSVFSPLFESIKAEKLSEEIQNSDKKINKSDPTAPLVKGMGLAKAFLANTSHVTREKKKISLSTYEAQKFRERILQALNQRVARDHEMIWNIPHLFQEQTFKVLLHQIHFNSPQLRAEVLNLIYRFNSHRAELAQYVLKEFQESRVEDVKTVTYVARQRSVLQQLLARFQLEEEKASVAEALSSKEMGAEAGTDDMDSFRLKKALLNSDTAHEAEGLINFCFPLSTALEAWAVDADADELVEVEGSTRFSPVKKKYKKFAAIMSKALSFKLLGGKRMKPKTKPHQISMNSSSRDIFSLEPNSMNQGILVDMDTHKIILEFLNKHVNSFMHSLEREKLNEAEAMSPQTSPVEKPVEEKKMHESEVNIELMNLPTESQFQYYEVFRVCFLFLRAIIYKNKDLAEQLSSRSTIAMAVKLRNHCEEAVNFLMDLVHFNPQVVCFMKETEFYAIINDMREVVVKVCASETANKKHKKGILSSPVDEFPFGKNTKNVVHSLSLLTSIMLADQDISISRLHQFISVLHQRHSSTGEHVGAEIDEDGAVVDPEHLPLIRRVLKIGLGATCISEGAPDSKSPIYREARYLCKLYQKETGRVCFSRFPQDILADPHIDALMYDGMRKYLGTWHLLPDFSPLKLHLKVIYILGSCAVGDEQMEKYCRLIFRNPRVVFQILMIDKYEIRQSYLRLLHGVWFSGLPGSPAAMELLSNDFRPYMVALFFLFCQDLRLFMLAKPDDVEDPTKRSGNVGDSALFQQQMDVMEHYIVEVMVPFLKDCVKSRICQEFDDYDQDQVSSSAVEMISIRYTLTDLLKETTVLIAEILVAGYVENFVRSGPKALLCLRTILENSKVDMSSEGGLRHGPAYQEDATIRHALRIVNSKEKEITLKMMNKSLTVKPKESEKVGSSMMLGAKHDSKNTAIDTTVGDEPHEWNMEKKQSMLKFNCLMEFIPVVDRFATLNATHINHLVFVPEPQFLYFEDRHVAVNGGEDVTSGDLTQKVELIQNPTNSRFFRYTMNELSKYFMSFAKFAQPERYDEIISLIHLLPNNKEVSFLEIDQSINLHQDLNFFFDDVSTAEATRKHRESHRLLFWSKSKEDLALKESRRFSLEQFSRWSKHGGMLLELLLEHMLFCMECYEGENGGLDRVSCSFDEMCKCNAYWMDLFTKGLLRNRLAELYEMYSEQTEIQMAQLTIESNRLHLMQEVFADLNAVRVLVTQLGTSPEQLVSVAGLAPTSIRLLHQMAINLGTSLTETGNHVLQNMIVEAIQKDYEDNMSLGVNQHFMASIRIMLQSYSSHFSTRDGLHRNAVTEVVKLLRFISLLCEGHNKNTQLYVGKFDVVSEVANFVHDMSRLLAREMNDAMVTENEVMSKFYPKVLGYKRGVIRWVNPMPKRGRDRGSDTKEYKFLPLERMSLLCEVVQSGLEALSEFSQGPCFENQLMIARAGSTREFGTFFSFFGAFQLQITFDVPLQRGEKDLAAFSKSFKRKVRAAFSHENLLHLQHNTVTNSSGVTQPSPVGWYGNDPLALQILLNEVRVHAHDASEDLTSEQPIPTPNTKKKRRASFVSGVGQNPRKLINGGIEMLNYVGSAKVEPMDVRGMDIASLDDWEEEKEEFVLDRADGKCGCNNDNNYYNKIIEFGELLAELEMSCLKLSRSLLEGSVMDEIDEVPRIVIQNIDKTNLISNMANYWSRFLSYNPLHNKGRESEAAKDCFERNMSYEYYHLSMRITDLTTYSSGMKQLVDVWLEETGINIDEHIARIELRSPEEKANALVVTYFPVPALIHTYWDRGDIVELRNNILYPTSTGKRDSVDEKVKFFLRDGVILIATLRHLESLDEIWAVKNFVFYILVAIAHNMNRWGYLTFILSMALNFMLIIGVRSTENGFFIYNPLFQVIIYWLGVAQLGSSGLAAYSYTIMYGLLYIRLGVRDNPDCEGEINGSIVSKLALMLNYLGLFGVGKAHLQGNVLKYKSWMITSQLYYFFSRGETWYYFCLLSFSALGNFVNPLFFSVCLIEVMRMSKLMQYVTKAFTANIDQVIATILLAALIIYLFVTIAYSTNTLRNQYYFDELGFDGCFSLESCFRLHLDYGMLQPMFWKYPGHIESPQGEIFNFMFTFIMQIVIPGLVSGIIIDTFSEMRGMKQAIEEDVVNTCFICNIDREDFETANVAFNDHIKTDHNMWKYLWFMVYLDEKDPTEYDGIEQFCNQIISIGDHSPRWLPLKIARALSKVRDKYDLFTIYNKILSLQSNVDKIDNNLKNDLNSQEKNIREALRAESGNSEGVLQDQLSRLEISLLSKILVAMNRSDAQEEEKDKASVAELKGKKFN